MLVYPPHKSSQTTPIINNAATSIFFSLFLSVTHFLQFRVCHVLNSSFAIADFKSSNSLKQKCLGQRRRQTLRQKQSGVRWRQRIWAHGIPVTLVKTLTRESGSEPSTFRDLHPHCIARIGPRIVPCSYSRGQREQRKRRFNTVSLVAYRRKTSCGWFAAIYGTVSVYWLESS
jgi:hypothetical protein